MSQVEKALQPRFGIDQHPDGWVPPNRAKFTTWIDKQFKYGKAPKPVCSECTDGECSVHTKKSIRQFPHQEFVKDYMQYSSPYRGLLLYHSLGSGKSATSIAAAEILMNNMDVCVLLPASLHPNYVNEVRKSGRRYFELQQHWTKNPSPSPEDIRKLKIDPAKVKRHKGLWVPDASKPSNFNSLSPEEAKQVTEQTQNIIDNRFNILHYDGQSYKSLKKLDDEAKAQGKQSPFDNTCVVIDEVHNLVGRIVNGGVTGRPIYNMLMNASNCKVILLSGTPVINYPYEIAYIINLITGNRTLYTSDIERGSLEQLEDNMSRSRYVDYFRIDRPKKRLYFSLLPEGFEWKSQTEITVSRTDSKDALYSLTKALSDVGIRLSEPKPQPAVRKPARKQDYYFRALPEDEDVFNSTFIDMEKGTFRNGMMFMRRILGAVSYYNSMSPEFFPSVKTNQVPLKMPDNMFREYAEKRMVERKKEQGAKPSGGNIFKDSGQVYRFYSRAISNFVFPDEIKRVFPSDLRKIKNEIDDIDRFLERSVEPTSTEMDKKYEASLNDAVNRVRTGDYLLLDNIGRYSPKFYNIVKKLQSIDGSSLVYSQFRKVEGLGLLCAALDRNGWSEFRVKRNPDTKQWELDMPPEDLEKPHYFQFRGNTDETSLLMRIFNCTSNDDFDALPQSIRSGLWAQSNMRGELIKTIMITQSGSEGISLKNVRQVHIVEPYWNHIRLDQVVGRAVRTCSHQALPPEDRNVEVFVYYMVFTEKQLENFTIQAKDKSMTSDQYLYDLALRKKKITDEMLSLLKSAAVDCGLNAREHSKEGIRCFSFPTNVDDDKMTHTFSLSDETFDNQYKLETEEKTWKGQVIVTKKGRFLLRKETNDIYDYDIYVDAGRLVKLGKLIEREGKRVIKMRPDGNGSASPAPKRSASPAPKEPTPKGSPINLGVFRWSSNSCYMDSLFVATMHRPNPIASMILAAKPRYTGNNQKLLKRYTDAIKEKLQLVYTNISSGGSMLCTDLRKDFDKFQRQYMKQIDEDIEEIDWLSSQQEPRDVFSHMLERAFVIDNNTVIQTVVNGNKNEPQHVDFAYVNIRMLDSNDSVERYIPTQTEEFYNNIDKKMTRKETNILSSNGLFVNVQRGYKKDEDGTELKSNARLSVKDSVSLKDGSKLELASIVVHTGTTVHGGHYTAYIRHKDRWYLFDDMKASYELVSKIPSSVYENLTGLVYI